MMKQRKTMRLWQMLVLAAICLALLINMFLPLWNVNGTKLVDWIMSEADEIAATQEMTIGQIKELQDKIEEKKENKEELEKLAEQYDDEIETMEDKIGIHIFSLSSIGAVTMDINALALGNKEYTEADLEKFEKRLDEEQGLKEAKQGIVKGKWLFGTMHLFETILLIFILISFFLKWDKRIVSIPAVLYGCYKAISYGIAWWGMAGGVVGDIEDKELVEKLRPLIESFWNSVVGIGTILGFMLGILLVVMGIITCFVGKATVVSGGNIEPEWDIDRISAGKIHMYGDGQRVGGFVEDERGRLYVDGHLEWEDESGSNGQQQHEPVSVKPPKPKYGRVKCTQGVAMGQGFKLPEDRKVIIGKSPQNATLVIHDPHISNVHCSVRYRVETDSYIVKDHSTNGTFVHGMRLGKDVAMEYPAGTVLSLADGTNKVLLG